MHTAHETTWETRESDSASTPRLESGRARRGSTRAEALTAVPPPPSLLATPEHEHIIALMRELYASGDADGALSLAALVADTTSAEKEGVDRDREQDAFDDEDIETLWDSSAVPSFRTLHIPERSMDAATASLLGLIDGETRLARIFDCLAPEISKADALTALQGLIDEGVIVTR